MTETEKKVIKNSINFALIIFIIVFGLILLGNLFELLPWEIWRQGIFFVAIVFIINFLYKILSKKNWAYNTSQILILILTFILFSHTILALTTPDYLEIKREELTNLELYHQTMELRTAMYDSIKSKSLNAKIQKGYYIITDSIEEHYYFKMHPPQQTDATAFVTHTEVDSNLEIDFQSANYILSALQRYLNIHPTLIFGTPYIPLSMNLIVEGEGNVQVNLRDKRVEEFSGLLETGESSISFSAKSLPRSKFVLTIRGGILEMHLPKELEHKIKYVVRNDAKFFIGNKQVIGQGEYKIISDGEENPCEIKVDLDFGELRINVH